VGKWAFRPNNFSNWSKSPKNGQKTPKKGRFEKMPPIFHAHFCLSKVGFCPLFLAKKPKNRPNTLQNSTQISPKLKKPILQKIKVGVN